jgi:hypothetical protein
MRIRLGMAAGWGAVAMGVAWAASCAQAQMPSAAGGPTAVQDSGANLGQGEILREIDDPNNGNRWLLMRNKQSPGGPGRLVLVAARHKVAGVAQAQGAGESGNVPVIHLGDRLIIEEHTAVVDAVLEARALAPAMAGAAFDARLTLGGGVIRVVAVGPGRAALPAGTGARR